MPRFLCHPQKDDAVNRALHGVVEIVNAQARIAQCDIPSQHIASLDLRAKNSASTSLVPCPCRPDKLVKRTAQNGLA